MLDDSLPRALLQHEKPACARWLTPLDEQLIGGMVPHRNTIAEMKTGEGKTLRPLAVSILPFSPAVARTCYAQRHLSKYGVQWMGPIICWLDGCCDPVAGPDPLLSSFIMILWRRADDRYHHLRPCTPRPIKRISPTGPTTSSALTICATIWCRYQPARAARVYYAIVDEVDNILIDDSAHAADHPGRGPGVG